MKHLEDAAIAVNNKFISLDEITHSVEFTIQDGPIKEVGENGCQAADMLEFVKELFKSLDNTHPCQENKNTITNLNKAIYWQIQRTKDRTNRGVESKMKD